MAARNRSDNQSLFTRHLDRALSKLLTQAKQPHGEQNRQVVFERTIHLLSLLLDHETPGRLLAWPQARALLLLLSPRMEQAGWWSTWLPILQCAVVVCTEQMDVRAEADLQYQTGFLHQLRAEYDQADTALARSAKLYAALDDKRLQATALARRAYVLNSTGRLQEAKQLLSQASGLLSGSGDEDEYLHFVAGILAQRERNWPVAESCLLASLRLCEAQGHRRNQAKRLVALANFYQAQDRFRLARNHCEAAIDIFEALDDPVECAIARMNLGIALSDLGDPWAALGQYRLVEPVLRDAYDRVNLARLYSNRGYELSVLGRRQEAEDAYVASLTQFEDLGEMVELMATRLFFGSALLRLGDAHAAVDLHRSTLGRLDAIADTPDHARLLADAERRLSEALVVLQETGEGDRVETGRQA